MVSPPPSDHNERVRLDVALVARGLARSRAEAQGLIRAGDVSVSGTPATKPSQMVQAGEEIVAGAGCRYVSRGGVKLLAALAAFAIDPSGLACLDVGASTGGFTDCLLQRGAASVVAIDVGHSQMHPRIMADPRVRSFEGMNVREMDKKLVGGPFDLIAVDLSFISATLALPALVPLLRTGRRVIVLVKPQFEAGRAALDNKGVVRSEADRKRAVARVTEAAQALGLAVIGLIESPIAGGEGNIEYLAVFAKPLD